MKDPACNQSWDQLEHRQISHTYSNPTDALPRTVLLKTDGSHQWTKGVAQMQGEWFGGLDTDGNISQVADPADDHEAGEEGKWLLP